MTKSMFDNFTKLNKNDNIDRKYRNIKSQQIDI